MNIKDRAELTKASVMIAEARAIIEAIAEGEQEKFDNMSEGLQASERGARMEQAASELADAVDTLDEVLTVIEQAQE